MCVGTFAGLSVNSHGSLGHQKADYGTILIPGRIPDQIRRRVANRATRGGTPSLSLSDAETLVKLEMARIVQDVEVGTRALCDL